MVVISLRSSEELMTKSRSRTVKFVQIKPAVSQKTSLTAN